MADNFQTALLKSSDRFNRLVVPILKEWFQLEFMSIENDKSNELFKMFDIHCGIDIWSYCKFGARGIASRIQVNNKSWDTFTVRKHRQTGSQTEYEKRKRAIESDWLYPYYTLQAYIDKNDNLLSLAITKTKDLISYIDNGQAQTRHTRDNQIGQASFYIIQWDKYELFTKNLKIYRGSCYESTLANRN